MINIYTPENLLEAQCLKDMLMGRHIFCHLGGIDLLGAIGCVPAHGLLGLYVESDDAVLAKQLINEYLSAQPLQGEDQ